MRNKLLVAVLVGLAVCLVGMACSEADEEVPELTPTVEFVHAPGYGAAAPGPQVVTEEYLRYHLDLKMAQMYTAIFAEMYMNGGWQVAVTKVDAATWDKDKRVTVTFGRTFYSSIAGPLKGKTYYLGDQVTITFGGANYSGGSVTEGACKQLPGGGTATTGEYTVIDNTQNSTPDSHHVEKTVTESTSTSTTLNESLELSNGTTVEAGADFGAGSGSVSDTFTTTFGLSKESTEDHSKETSVTVSDDVDIPERRKVAVVFTTNDSATNCDVHINAAGDWSSLDVDLGGIKSRKFLIQDKGDLGSHAIPMRSYFDGDLIQDGKFTCDEADCLYRVATGYDVRCPGCGRAPLSWEAKRRLGEVKNASERYVTFDGTRHSASRRDASLQIIDVTGLDADCTADALNDSGKPVDGLLDACRN